MYENVSIIILSFFICILFMGPCAQRKARASTETGTEQAIILNPWLGHGCLGVFSGFAQACWFTCTYGHFLNILINT